MPKLTDYVREGFKRRRRPWDGGELPEWWDVLVWAAFGMICLILVLGAVFGGDHAGTRRVARRAPAFPVQTVNPYATPSRTTNAPPPSGADLSPAGFSAAAPVQVGRTGGGAAVVPAGARNVALAAAKAEATGIWSGVPLVGTARPKPARRAPRGKVIGDVTVADPALTGNGSYLFSVMITHDAAAESYLVKIAVERTPDGYAVLLG